MKIFDGHDSEMVYIESVESKGDNLVMKAKLMGSMPATVYLKPEEMWAAKKLISWKIIRASLRMFLKGRRLAKSAS